jgi:hypothetical protein
MKQEVMGEKEIEKRRKDTYFGCIGLASLLSRAEESWISIAMTRTMAPRKAKVVAVDFIFESVVGSQSVGIFGSSCRFLIWKGRERSIGLPIFILEKSSLRFFSRVTHTNIGGFLQVS